MYKFILESKEDGVKEEVSEERVRKLIRSHFHDADLIFAYLLEQGPISTTWYYIEAQKIEEVENEMVSDVVQDEHEFKNLDVGG